MSQPKPARYVSDFAPGAVLRDYTDPGSGLRMMVRRGGFCFCAYVGVRSDHPLAGLEELNFQCHRGVNFQEWGTPGTCWEEGWYWWGWDYGHAGDVQDYVGMLGEEAHNPEAQELVRALQRMSSPHTPWGPSKNWTFEEVCEDALDVLQELKAALQESGELAKLVVRGPAPSA